VCSVLTEKWIEVRNRWRGNDLSRYKTWIIKSLWELTGCRSKKEINIINHKSQKFSVTEGRHLLSCQSQRMMWGHVSQHVPRRLELVASTKTQARITSLDTIRWHLQSNFTLYSKHHQSGVLAEATSRRPMSKSAEPEGSILLSTKLSTHVATPQKIWSTLYSSNKNVTPTFNM